MTIIPQRLLHNEPRNCEYSHHYSSRTQTKSETKSETKSGTKGETKSRSSTFRHGKKVEIKRVDQRSNQIAAGGAKVHTRHIHTSKYIPQQAVIKAAGGERGNAGVHAVLRVEHQLRVSPSLQAQE